MACFDDYADFYDLFYADKDYAGEVAWVVAEAARRGISAGRWLDVGCGTGRHLEKVPAGFERVGLDRSPRMAAVARERLGAATIRVGSATELPVQGPLDVCASFFAVASYLAGPDDLERFARRAADLLRPGGLLYFDAWYGPGVVADPPAARWQEYAAGSQRVLRLSRPTFEPLAHLTHVDYEVLVLDQGRLLHQVRERHTLRHYFPAELRELLSRAGFRDVLLVEPGKSGVPAPTTWTIAVFATRAS